MVRRGEEGEEHWGEQVEAMQVCAAQEQDSSLRMRPVFEMKWRYGNIQL